MKSKIDVLSYNSTYQWDRYETGPARIYQWQKYEYGVEYHHYYDNYPVMALDRDYTCYGEYTTEYVENCYANFNRTSWDKMGAARFWYWNAGEDEPVVGGYSNGEGFLPFSHNYIMGMENDLMVKDKDWINENEINKSEKIYLQGPFVYQFSKQVIQGYSEFSYLPLANYYSTYDADIDMTSVNVRKIDINFNDYDFSVIYAGVRHRNNIDAAMRVINGNVWVHRTGFDYKLSLYSQGYTLVDYFIKHKTQNKYIYTGIVKQVSGDSEEYPDLLHFGKMPNSEFIQTSAMLFYPVSLYSTRKATSMTDYGNIQTGRFNSKGILIDAMSPEFMGYTTQPDSRYYQIGPVRGETRDNLVFKFTSNPIDLSNTTRFEQLGVISQGTLVPFKWHISFCHSAFPLNRPHSDVAFLWNGEYLCWGLQIEKIPMLGILWGFEDDGVTYYQEKKTDNGTYYKEHYYITNCDRLDLMSALDLTDDRGLCDRNVIIDDFQTDKWPIRNFTYYSEPFRGVFGDGYFHHPAIRNWAEVDLYDMIQNSKQSYRGYAIKIYQTEGTVILGKKQGTISSLDRHEFADEGIYNGYYLKFLDASWIQHSKIGLPTPVYSSNKNNYPLNGLMKVGNIYYWYVFRNRTYSLRRTYDADELLGNVSLTQSAGSADAFSVGTIGGGSISFDVLKPISEVLPYNNYDVLLTYTFGNGEKVQEGIYTIKEITENGLNKTHVVAYDTTHKLDIQFKPLGDRITFPITAQRLFNTICSYCGIPFRVEYDFLNDTAEIESAFGDEKTTCREVMEWIAQIAGGIIVADEEGYLVIKSMTQGAYSRGSRSVDTFSLDVSMLPIQKPTAIQYKDGDDVRLVVADRTSNIILLDYTDNPFTFYSDKKLVNEWLKNTINSIGALGDIFSFNVKIMDDSYNIQCGDSWVVSSESVNPRRGVIQNKSIDNSGVVYTSSGEIVSLSSDKALNGNQIDAIVDEVSRMYSQIIVDKFVVRDSLTGEEILVIRETYVFTPENTTYQNGELSFDISSQYDALYHGLTENVLMDNGETWPCFIKDGVMTFTSDSFIPPSFRNIGFEIRNEFEEVEYSWASGEIDSADNGSFFRIVNEDISFIIVASVYPSTSSVMDIPTLKTYLQKLSYTVSDGDYVFDSIEENIFYNEDLDEYIAIESSYPINWRYVDYIVLSYYNHTLTLKYVNQAISQNIVINSININNWDLTVAGVESFPITIPAGTYEYQIPKYRVYYDDYDYIYSTISHNVENDTWDCNTMIGYSNNWNTFDTDNKAISNGALNYTVKPLPTIIKRIRFNEAGKTRIYDTDTVNEAILLRYLVMETNDSLVILELGRISTHKWADSSHTETIKTNWIWYPNEGEWLSVSGTSLSPQYFIEYRDGQFRVHKKLGSSTATVNSTYDPTTYTLEVNA